MSTPNDDENSKDPPPMTTRIENVGETPAASTVDADDPGLVEALGVVTLDEDRGREYDLEDLQRRLQEITMMMEQEKMKNKRLEEENVEERRQKEEERRQKEEERRQKEEERRQKEESLKREAEKDKIILKTEQKEKVGYVVDHGIPHIKLLYKEAKKGVKQAKSTNIVSDQLRAIDLKESSFLPLSDCSSDKLNREGSDIWRSHSDSEFTITNHGSVLEMVVLCVRDFLAAAGLKEALAHFVEPTITSYVKSVVYPDIVLVRKGTKTPVGVIKVKTPVSLSGPEGVVDTTHLQQIARYLLEIRHRFGSRFAFLVLTDYLSWRIYWPEDCDEMAQCTSFMNKVSRDGASFHYEDITLCCSKAYGPKDPQLTVIMASLFHKMNHGNQLGADGLISPTFHYPLYMCNAKTFSWTSIKIDASALSVKMPSEEDIAKGVFIIQNYHGNAHGRVLLLMTQCGKLAVWKSLVQKVDNYEEARDGEIDVWNSVWEAGVKRFNLGQDGILMPFALHARPKRNKSDVPEKSINHLRFSLPGRWTKTSKGHPILSISTGNPDSSADPMSVDNYDRKCMNEYAGNPVTVLREAAHELQNKGYCHGDLHWRHVALLPIECAEGESWRVKPILIDLTYVEDVTGESENERKEKVEKEVRRLVSELEDCVLEKLAKDPFPDSPESSTDEPTDGVA